MDYAKIKEARAFFECSDFFLEMYDASIKSYEAVENALNFSNFACNIRELLRLFLEKEAPDNLIEKCNWYKDEYITKDKNEPTRRARIRYYLLKTMNTSQVEKIFIDYKDYIDRIEKRYASIFKELNKYTHVTEESFYISAEQKEINFNSILNLLVFIINFVFSTKETTYKKLADFLYNDISNHIYQDAIDDNLDALSNHTCIDGINNLDFGIDRIDDEYIYISGTAGLDVDFSVTIPINDFCGAGYEYEKVKTELNES